MTTQQQPTSIDRIYPESDGRLLADNTKQFRWIVVIEQNLEGLFAENPDVFVAGDLLWYLVEGNPSLSTAPDAMEIKKKEIFIPRYKGGDSISPVERR